MNNKQIISIKLIMFGFGLIIFNNIDLQAKSMTESEIIESNKADLALYSQYGQSFSAKSSKNSDKEDELESRFAKLGINLEDIDYNLYNTLQEDRKNLQLISKKMIKCNKKNPNVITIQNDIKFYISNINQFISLCKQHKNFIRGYQILNFYNNIKSEQDKIVEWISHKINSLKTKKSFGEWFTGMTSDFTVYPLISYKNKVESDINWIKKIQTSEYANMSKKVKQLQESIKRSLTTLQKTNEYRLELQEERKDRRQAAINSSIQTLSLFR